MDDLIKKLMDQLDIGEDLAKNIVEVVSQFMNEKLPGGISDQVTSLLSGGLDQAGNLAERAGGLARGLGDILGGKDS